LNFKTNFRGNTPDPRPVGLNPRPQENDRKKKMAAQKRKP